MSLNKRQNKHKWENRITGSDGKHMCLGTFNTKQQAAAIHDVAAKKQNRPGVVLNFSSEEAAAAAVQAAATEWEEQQLLLGLFNTSVYSLS